MKINNKKMPDLYKLFTVILVIPVLLASCGKTSPEFTSKEELAGKTIELVNKGDTEALMNLLVKKDEFIKLYYPHFPEAKQKPSLSGEEFYRIFVGLERQVAVLFKIKQYKNQIPS